MNLEEDKAFVEDWLELEEDNLETLVRAFPEVAHFRRQQALLPALKGRVRRLCAEREQLEKKA